MTTKDSTTGSVAARDHTTIAGDLQTTKAGLAAGQPHGGGGSSEEGVKCLCLGLLNPLTGSIETKFLSWLCSPGGDDDFRQ